MQERPRHFHHVEDTVWRSAIGKGLDELFFGPTPDPGFDIAGEVATDVKAVGIETDAHPACEVCVVSIDPCPVDLGVAKAAHFCAQQVVSSSNRILRLSRSIQPPAPV